MKSIMEEASTITKAIENAWNRAGQPQEFSVKILEHPKTAFFGLKTEKSAKIAFFFTEVIQKAKDQIYQRPIQQRAPQGRSPQESVRKPHHQSPTPGHKTAAGKSSGSSSSNENHRLTPDNGHHEERPRRHAPRESRNDTPRVRQSHGHMTHESSAHGENERPTRTGNHPERHERPNTSTNSARPENRSDRPERYNDSGNRHDQSSAERPSRPEGRSEYKDNRRHHDERRDSAPAYNERRSDNRHDNRDSSVRPSFSDENRDTWTTDMVQNVQEWVKETLVLMGKPNISVTPHVSHNYLKLVLDNHVNDDARQEEVQLKSWSSLAMEALREKTNKPLRGLRIIMESNK